MIEIKRWDNNEVIHNGDFDTLKECLIGANLMVANLRWANLIGADLEGAEGILCFKSHVSHRVFYMVNHTDRIICKAGCFWGDTDELKKKIISEDKQETHKDYLMAIDYAKWSFEMENKND